MESIYFIIELKVEATNIEAGSLNLKPEYSNRIVRTILPRFDWSILVEINIVKGAEKPTYYNIFLINGRVCNNQSKTIELDL